MTTIYFVRHGVTDDTGRRLTGRHPGVHLNRDGTGQAEAAAAYLRNARIRALYSSPVDRALDTAHVIGKALGLTAETREGLAEVEFGKWTNRTMKALARTSLWGKAQRSPSSVRFPEGESFNDVQARAVTEIEKICAEHPRAGVCCVSHGDVIRLLVAHFLGMHIDMFQRIVVAPASISIVAAGDFTPRVLVVNSVPAAGRS